MKTILIAFLCGIILVECVSSRGYYEKRIYRDDLDDLDVLDDSNDLDERANENAPAAQGNNNANKPDASHPQPSQGAQCQKLGGTCEYDRDCCKKDCWAGRCCGKTGDHGCSVGGGKGTGGCCKSFLCTPIGSDKTQCYKGKSRKRDFWLRAFEDMLDEGEDISEDQDDDEDK